eukprot:scaffold61024_cov53-Phaeocystis_antarctica.AAC.3
MVGTGWGGAEGCGSGYGWAVFWGRLSGRGVLRGEARGQGRAGPADLALGSVPMRIASITAGEPSKAPRVRICDTTASKVCLSIMPGECSAEPLQRRARSRRRARIQRGESCRSRYGANQSTMYCSSSEAGLVPRRALPLAALPASNRTRRWRRIITASAVRAARTWRGTNDGTRVDRWVGHKRFPTTAATRPGGRVGKVHVVFGRRPHRAPPAP